MSLTLYFAPRSSASPIIWALAELDLPHEAIQLDLQAGDQKKPEVLQHNPNGQVPTLVDQGQGMFESSAIIVYLGERYGHEKGLWPKPGSPEHMVALSWNAWFAVSLGASMRLVMLNTQDWLPPELRNEGQAAHGLERLGAQLGLLDARLGEQPYVVGESFSLVDAYGAAAVGWATQVIGVDLKTIPNVAAWLGRCMGREAAKAMQ
ncbi:MAG: glutathione S-transferase family protein [Myxococcales bacterium]|nr:glutathione S-transferase family protein [Myxococcales bacterium]MCB9713484.1 glutathione S-transferase family protein [Myxococcales bacterium]